MNDYGLLYRDLIRLYRKGHTLFECAGQLQVSISTCRRMLMEAGVDRRRTGRRTRAQKRKVMA